MCMRQACKYETDDQCHRLHWCIQMMLCKNTIHHWWRNVGEVYEGFELWCTMGTTEVGLTYICRCLPDGRASSPLGSCDRNRSSKQHKQPNKKQTILEQQRISLRWFFANRCKNVSTWLLAGKWKLWTTSAKLVWPQWVLLLNQVQQASPHQPKK